MARPALQALAEQQQTLQTQAGLLARANQQLSVQAQRIAAQDQTIGQFKTAFAMQRDQISACTRGIRAIAEAAGIEGHVRTAMLRTADEQNPAQPIPEPPAVPPAQTTQDVKTPEAFADVQAPGMIPGSTNDVAADATSTVYTPGNDIDAPAVKNLVDVTAPVDGTQGPRPLNEVRTLTDVRVGDPMNPSPAFPLRGDFANAQRLGSREAASNRTMAALRLARLRIQAGTASADNDFAVATEIEKNASMTTEAIEAEIHTLESVSKAAARQPRPAGLVPRAASTGQRSVPSMQAVGGSGASAANDDTMDADLYMP
jgi:hypothetical protein